MVESPKVSVVMPVYNGRPYVRQAIQSILDQTLENFEFIIVNDGSTDGSKEILEEYNKKDERIRLLHQENQGVALSLNRGLSAAQGQYIARMDADDKTDPIRLAREVDFLESNPNVGVVGTQVRMIDKSGNPNGEWRLPTDPNVISWEVLFHTPFCHPTIMARRTLLEKLGGYAEWATHAEDYELWTRITRESELVNLSETLHSFRKWGGSVTAEKLEDSIRNCCRAAFILHRTLLNEGADMQLSSFLVWTRFQGTQTAMEKVENENLISVYEYVRHLYRGFRRDVQSNNINPEVRRRAVAKRAQIADEIGISQGSGIGTWYKLHSRLIGPFRKDLSWLLREVWGRIMNQS